MADKSYKKLSEKLGKKNTGGNFRTYQEISRDTRADKINKLKEPAPIKKKHTKPPKPDTVGVKGALELWAPQIMVISAVVLLLALGYFLFIRDNAVEIIMNGDAVAHVKNKAMTAEDIINTVVARIEKEEETLIQIEDVIEVAPVRGRGRFLMDENALIETLVSDVVYRVNAAEITVNGLSVGIVKNEQTANNLLDSFKSKYIGNANITAEFVEDVKVTSSFFRRDAVIDAELVLSELGKTMTSIEIYVAKPGDNISKIMEAHNMSLQQLTELNPDYNMATPLQIGEEIRVSIVTPFVSVRTIETKTEELPVPRGDPITQTDNTLPPGMTRIIREGRDGRKRVTTEIIRVNGTIVGTSEMEELQLEAPESRIVAVSG
jgi:hypothetical protein